MSDGILDFGVAFLLGLCFAALGDWLLARKSSTLFLANESFLVGATASAALLFPLTLITGDYTLAVILTVLVVFLGMWVVRYSRPLSRPDLALCDRKDWVCTLGISALFALVTCFGVLNSLHGLGSDGLNIWAAKATVLYHSGGLTKDLWADAGELNRVVDYPPLIPFYEALVGKVGYNLTLSSLKPIFTLFYASMLLSTYCGARTFLNQRYSIAAVVLLAATPAISLGNNLQGFADLPMASGVAALMSAWLRHHPDEYNFRSPVPWLTAGLLTIKSEGTILFVTSICVAALLWSLHARQSKSSGDGRRLWKWAVICGSSLLLRYSYLKWTGVVDLTYGPVNLFSGSRAFFIGIDIPARCWITISNLSEWGFFWHAFLVFALVVMLRGNLVQRGLAIWVMASLTGYVSVFYFTNWDYIRHIDTAFSRLAEHLAPVASVVIFSGIAMLARSREESPLGIRSRPGTYAGPGDPVTG